MLASVAQPSGPELVEGGGCTSARLFAQSIARDEMNARKEPEEEG
jgi:hypothetical protein